MKKYYDPEVSVVKFNDKDVVCLSFTVPSDPSQIQEGDGKDAR